MITKKADLTGVIYLVAMVSAFAIFILIASYVGTTLSTQLSGNMTADGYTEIQDAFQQTDNISQNTLSSLWFILFGGLLIGLMITAWLIPTHPVYAVPFIILLVVAVIVGVAMSNAYYEIKQVTELQDAAAQQSGVGWIMDRLPYVALIVGLLSLVITFAKPGGVGGGEAAPSM